MSKKILSLLVLGALVVLGCGLSLPGVAEPTPTVALPTDVPTAVPTEVPTNTPTPEPTAIPLPTATAEPTATQENVPTEGAPPETYLSDDYADPNSQLWILDLITDPALEGFEYRDGRLYLFNNYFTEDAFGITQATYLNLPQDFAATVEIEFGADSSDLAEAGIVFRVGSDFTDYEFTITPDGQYSIFKYDGEFVALVDYTASDVIRTGPGAVNQMTVLADGDNLSFLLNGVLVEEVVDDDVVGSDFGLVVYNFDDIGANAYFDNLLVTSLSAYLVAPPSVP